MTLKERSDMRDDEPEAQDRLKAVFVAEWVQAGVILVPDYSCLDVLSLFGHVAPVSYFYLFHMHFHSWTLTTTLPYPLYLFLSKPPESYKQLISVGLFCKWCYLSSRIDFHFF